MSTPQSIIKVCSGVRLTSKYDHTIYFSTVGNQNTYFDSKVVKSFVAYTYLRKSWTIKVNESIDNAIDWSYLFFTNGGKRYYYFINDVEYINDSTVELTLELDVMQTYAFDYDLLDCFVEREHIADDVIGANTVDENIDVGEYIEPNDHPHTIVDLNELCILVMSTIDLLLFEATYNEETPSESHFVRNSSKYDGVFGGTCVFAVKSSNWSKLADLLAKLDNAGLTDAIMSIWMYPRNLVKLYVPEGSGEEWNETFACTRVTGSKMIDKTHALNLTKLNGYTPKNKKLLQYPYNIINVTNNNGGAVALRPEQYKDAQQIMFVGLGTVTPDAEIVLFPMNYNGQLECFEMGLKLGGFPTCSWNSDTYKLWLAQNHNQQGMQMVAGAGMVVAGIGTAIFSSGAGAVAGAGMIMGGVSQIAGLITQNKDRAIVPPTAHGNQSVSVNTAHGKQTFEIFSKCVDPYHAKTIDDYFSMFGYKTCQVKKPNINSRPQFNYVKTVGTTVRGDIPQRDLTKINEIFNGGVTFWKNGDKIGDYSVTNI